MFRYSDHTYIVLTLQKLVHVHPEDDDDDGGNDEAYSTEGSKFPRRARLMRRIHRIFGRGSKQENTHPKSPDGTLNGDVLKPTTELVSAHTERVHKLRTLQRYHGGPNQERMAFMEEKSALTAKNLAVCAEQVSIFLTSG